MQIERVSYRDLPNCYRLSNGVIELIITGDVGIRIIRFGFVGDRNEFFEEESLAIPEDKNTFKLYGGHRLWHAPEHDLRTARPDNALITIEEDGNYVTMRQPVEELAYIAKTIRIRFYADTPTVEVLHLLENRNVWDVQLASWALSVMSPGGMAIIPLPPRGTHPEQLSPSSTLALWPYTDLSDPRWQFGRKYLYLHQDVNATTSQKIGAFVSEGWAAYVNDGHVFIKTFEDFTFSPHTDKGSNVEVFTSADMLELETLSPLHTLPEWRRAGHIEWWTLAKDIPAITSDEDVDKYILPIVKKIQNK